MNEKNKTTAVNYNICQTIISNLKNKTNLKKYSSENKIQTIFNNSNKINPSKELVFEPNILLINIGSNKNEINNFFKLINISGTKLKIKISPVLNKYFNIPENIFYLFPGFNFTQIVKINKGDELIEEFSDTINIKTKNNNYSYKVIIKKNEHLIEFPNIIDLGIIRLESKFSFKITNKSAINLNFEIKGNVPFILIKNSNIELKINEEKIIKCFYKTHTSGKFHNEIILSQVNTNKNYSINVIGVVKELKYEIKDKKGNNLNLFELGNVLTGKSKEMSFVLNNISDQNLSFLITKYSEKYKNSSINSNETLNQDLKIIFFKNLFDITPNTFDLTPGKSQEIKIVYNSEISQDKQIILNKYFISNQEDKLKYVVNKEILISQMFTIIVNEIEIIQNINVNICEYLALLWIDTQVFDFGEILINSTKQLSFKIGNSNNLFTLNVEFPFGSYFKFSQKSALIEPNNEIIMFINFKSPFIGEYRENIYLSVGAIQYLIKIKANILDKRERSSKKELFGNMISTNSSMEFKRVKNSKYLISSRSIDNASNKLTKTKTLNKFKIQNFALKVLPKIKFDHKIKQINNNYNIDEIIKSKIFFNSTTNNQVQIFQIKEKLNEEQLVKLNLLNPIIDFEEIMLGKTYTKYICLANENSDLFVEVNFKNDSEDWFVKSNYHIQIIPPNRVACFPIIICLKTEELNQYNLIYKINNNHLFKIKIIFKVFKPDIIVDRDEVNFCFNNLIDTISCTNFITLKNKYDINIKYEILFEKNSNFSIIKNDDGILKIKESKSIDIKYHPKNLIKTEYLTIKIINGDKKKIKLIGEYNECICFPNTKFIDFGVVVTQTVVKKTFELININEIENSYFSINLNSVPSFMTFSKSEGKIINGQKIKITIVCKSNVDLLIISNPININFRGGSVITINYKIEFVYPSLILFSKFDLIKETNLGALYNTKLFLKNNTNAFMRVIVKINCSTESFKNNNAICWIENDNSNKYYPKINHESFLSLLEYSNKDLNQVLNSFLEKSIQITNNSELLETNSNLIFNEFEINCNIESKEQIELNIFLLPLVLDKIMIKIDFCLKDINYSFQSLNFNTVSNKCNYVIYPFLKSIDFSNNSKNFDNSNSNNSFRYIYIYNFTEDQIINWRIVNYINIQKVINIEYISGCIDSNSLLSLKIVPINERGDIKEIIEFEISIKDQLYTEKFQITRVDFNNLILFDDNEIIMNPTFCNILTLTYFKIYIYNSEYKNLYNYYFLISNENQNIKFEINKLIDENKNGIRTLILEISYISKLALEINSKLIITSENKDEYSIPIYGQVYNQLSLLYLQIELGNYVEIIKDISKKDKILEKIKLTSKFSTNIDFSQFPELKSINNCKLNNDIKNALLIRESNYKKYEDICRKTYKEFFKEICLIIKTIINVYFSDSIINFPKDYIDDPKKLLSLLIKFNLFGFENSNSFIFSNIESLQLIYNILNFLNDRNYFVKIINPKYLSTYENYVKFTKLNSNKKLNCIEKLCLSYEDFKLNSKINWILLFILIINKKLISNIKINEIQYAFEFFLSDKNIDRFQWLIGNDLTEYKGVKFSNIFIKKLSEQLIIKNNFLNNEKKSILNSYLIKNEDLILISWLYLFEVFEKYININFANKDFTYLLNKIILCYLSIDLEFLYAKEEVYKNELKNIFYFLFVDNHFDEIFDLDKFKLKNISFKISIHIFSFLLFNILNGLISNQIIPFKCSLHEKVEQEIAINFSKSIKSFFNIKIINEKIFNSSIKHFKIEDKNQYLIFLNFIALSNSQEKGKMIILNTKNEKLNINPISFKLIGNVKILKPYKVIVLENIFLYEEIFVEIEIENPFNQIVNFNATVHEVNIQFNISKKKNYELDNNRYISPIFIMDDNFKISEKSKINIKIAVLPYTLNKSIVTIKLLDLDSGEVFYDIVLEPKNPKYIQNETIQVNDSKFSNFIYLHFINDKLVFILKRIEQYLLERNETKIIDMINNILNNYYRQYNMILEENEYINLVTNKFKFKILKNKNEKDFIRISNNSNYKLKLILKNNKNVRNSNIMLNIFDQHKFDVRFINLIFSNYGSPINEEINIVAEIRTNFKKMYKFNNINLNAIEDIIIENKNDLSNSNILFLIQEIGNSEKFLKIIIEFKFNIIQNISKKIILKNNFEKKIYHFHLNIKIENEKAENKIILNGSQYKKLNYNLCILSPYLDINSFKVSGNQNIIKSNSELLFINSKVNIEFDTSFEFSGVYTEKLYFINGEKSFLYLIIFVIEQFKLEIECTFKIILFKNHSNVISIDSNLSLSKEFHLVENMGQLKVPEIILLDSELKKTIEIEHKSFILENKKWELKYLSKENNLILIKIIINVSNPEKIISKDNICFENQKKDIDISFTNLFSKNLEFEIKNVNSNLFKINPNKFILNKDEKQIIIVSFESSKTGNFNYLFSVTNKEYCQKYEIFCNYIPAYSIFESEIEVELNQTFTDILRLPDKYKNFKDITSKIRNIENYQDCFIKISNRNNKIEILENEYEFTFKTIHVQKYNLFIDFIYYNLKIYSINIIINIYETIEDIAINIKSISSINYDKEMILYFDNQLIKIFNGIINLKTKFRNDKFLKDLNEFKIKLLSVESFENKLKAKFLVSFYSEKFINEIGSLFLMNIYNQNKRIAINIQNSLPKIYSTIKCNFDNYIVKLHKFKLEYSKLKSNEIFKTYFEDQTNNVIEIEPKSGILNCKEYSINFSVIILNNNFKDFVKTFCIESETKMWRININCIINTT